MIDLILTVLFILILAFHAGYSNGWMDWIKFKKLDHEEWKNKWYQKHVKSLEGYTYQLVGLSKSPWYYFGWHTPKFKERFAYSSTILVFITDQWHAFKWLTFFYYELALSSVIVYYEGLAWWFVIIGIIILKTVRGLGFTLKYDKKS